MKYFLPFLLGIVSTLSTRAQTDPFQQQVSLHCEQCTISKLLDELTEKLSVTFSYSSRTLPVNRKLTLHVDNQPLSVVLDELLLGLQVEYSWTAGKVVLRKSNPDSNPPPTGTISGYLRDRENGETLIGATVYLRSINQGTVTNSYGFFSLTVPQGRYEIEYAYIGYETQVRPITLSENIQENISLQSDVSMLAELVIKPSDSLQNMDNLLSNANQIRMENVLKKPPPLGEPDVIKSLESQPGVGLYRDGSTFYNVRGGGRDQNQILVDEAPIYNSAHLLGLFSSFLPEAIKDLKLYRGTAPARYGGRVSSVMDIYTRDGNMQHFGGEGRLGLVSTQLAVEGPFKKDKSSFFLAARRSIIGGLLRGVGVNLNELYFADFTAKANLSLNKKNRLFISTFSSKDEYLNNGGLRWENKAGTIRWNHIFSDRLFLNTTFYTSKYEYQLLPGNGLIWKNHITNATLKADFSFYKDPKTTRHFGAKLSGHNFNPGNVQVINGPEVVLVPKKNAAEFSMYLSNEKKLSERWQLNYGFRLSSWSNYGRTIEYVVGENYQIVDTLILENRSRYNKYANLEPRINLSYLAGPNHLLKFNYSRNVQYLNLISNSISPFNNLEVWLPASINIKPQIADQFTLGWVHQKQHWQLEVETYYKNLNNQLDYSNHAQLLLNPLLESQLRFGKGHAYGLEATILKKTGKWKGSASYTYSRALRKIQGINNNRIYPALWDIPHRVDVNLGYEKSNRVTFSGALTISTGAPNTTPTSFYRYSGRVVPYYESKNNGRLPTYHRFDLAWIYRINKREQRFNHFLTISMFNFYGQKNSILQSFNKIQLEDGSFQTPTDLNQEVFISPTHRFVYRVIPSINYSFRL